ncbi:MAG: MBL fold metallo-hydrolase [Bacteroidales bacterium]|nr:MBL fold metallo-hydrolase [Bacteroidales bacterium]
MNIHSIETGFFSTDGGAMFGIVSRKVWSGKYPVDNENRCPLAMRILFADMGEHKVLFDTGVGLKKVNGSAYYRFHDLKNPVEELKALGYRAEEVTDVVLSHLHFDHCGGSVVMDESGNLVPAFPHAVYWASERQWEMAQNPPLWESDSFAPDVVKTLLNAGKLRLVNSDRRLFPGVSVKLVQGHTDDQLLSYIDTPSGTILFCGDVIPMTPHIMPLCIAAVDNSAVVSVDEKIRILEEAVENRQILFFFHDAVTEAVRLKKVNGRISVKEKISFA